MRQQFYLNILIWRSESITKYNVRIPVYAFLETEIESDKDPMSEDFFNDLVTKAVTKLSDEQPKTTWEMDDETLYNLNENEIITQI
jgi:hypothetical protein